MEAFKKTRIFGEKKSTLRSLFCFYLLLSLFCRIGGGARENGVMSHYILALSMIFFSSFRFVVFFLQTGTREHQLLARFSLLI